MKHTFLIVVLIAAFCAFGPVSASQDWDSAIAALNKKADGDRYGPYYKAADIIQRQLDGQQVPSDDLLKTRLLLGYCRLKLGADEPSQYLDSLEVVRPLLEVRCFTSLDIHEAKAAQLSAPAIAGHCYYRMGEYARAIEAFELELGERPKSQRIITLLVRARDKLTADGETSVRPVVVVGGNYINGAEMVASAVAVPSSALASSLILTEEKTASSAILLRDTKRPARVLSVTPVSIAGRDSQETYVPLRRVAEHFGAKVRWDPKAKIVWVN